MLYETMSAQGRCLFRWRSYLPLVILLPFIYEVQDYQWPLKSHRAQVAWELACMTISSIGLTIRCHVAGHVPVGTSGRNTRGLQAVSLNTTGMYSVVRNPLYLGNFLIWIGIALLCPMVSFLAVFLLAFWLYYERIIIAEEHFLAQRFGESFHRWAQDTPAFLPALHLWQAPELAFSFRAMLRREYTGLLGLGTGWIGMHAMTHWVIERRIYIEWYNIAIFVMCLITYIVIRLLKKHTTSLDVHGR
jgi:protein-S-isoprenylcysteine O-methyltransferase Ste14